MMRAVSERESVAVCSGRDTYNVVVRKKMIEPQTRLHVLMCILVAVVIVYLHIISNKIDNQNDIIKQQNTAAIRHNGHDPSVHSLRLIDL